MIPTAVQRRLAGSFAVLTIAMGCGGGAGDGAGTADARSVRYEDLITLFDEWRAFQRPKVLDGVPDYSSAAMTAQQSELATYQARLRAIDPSAWPTAQQVDYQIVRAEMNGLDFDHRVLKPWVNNPAFYVTVFGGESDQPAREGPHALGAVELWTYTHPISEADAAIVGTGLKAVPKLLDQARQNLVGTQQDIWIFGIGDLREQSAELEHLVSQLTEVRQELKADAIKAKEATDQLVAWAEAQSSSKTAPSGIGIDNYNWYLKNVQLLPYTWQDLVTIMEVELARSWAFLALEEERNKTLPPLPIVSSEQEHAGRFNTAVTDYMAYLKEHDLLTIKDYMEPRLRARIGGYSSAPREFFTEVDYRDPMVMRTHGFHWFDKGQMAAEPHASPVRRGALLYNIFNSRTEGLATEWEEMMLGAGMFDSRPRARELVMILLAERAARALGDLKMQGNQFTLEQASVFASANTPRAWLSLQGKLVRGEQHLYLQQPGYGISYVIGKIEIEKTMAARQRQLGEKFTLRSFMDEFLAAGQIPASLVRWQVTGELSDDLKALLDAKAASP